MGKMATAWQVHALLALYPRHTNLFNVNRELSFLENGCLPTIFAQALYLEVGLHCMY